MLTSLMIDMNTCVQGFGLSLSGGWCGGFALRTENDASESGMCFQ